MDGIKRITGVADNYTKVIPNVLPAFFSTIDCMDLKRTFEGEIHISYPAYNFPHKDLEIIPDVLISLKSKYQIENVVFEVTIPKDDPILNEFERRLTPYGLNEAVVNNGYCSQKELVAIYKRCDICFFPSLLETFSANLLEAMYFKQCIVASDYSFNREITSDAALYFEPLNALDAARKIVQILSDKNTRKYLVEKAFDRIKYYNNYQFHFLETVSFLRKVVEC